MVGMSFHLWLGHPEIRRNADTTLVIRRDLDNLHTVKCIRFLLVILNEVKDLGGGNLEA
jgi:hypothetical protein